jgi:hypothetical protein
MNNIQELVKTVERLGMRLKMADNNLLIDTPKGILTAELHHKLSQHKQAIISLLKEKQQSWLLKVETIANDYDLTLSDLQAFDTESMQDYRDNPAAIAILCQYLANLLKNNNPPKVSLPIQQPSLVCCHDCQHFVKDKIGSGAGIGRCSLGHEPTHPEPPLYPYTKRHCELIDLNKEITSHDI